MTVPHHRPHHQTVTSQAQEEAEEVEGQEDPLRGAGLEVQLDLGQQVFVGHVALAAGCVVVLALARVEAVVVGGGVPRRIERVGGRHGGGNLVCVLSFRF